VIGLIILALGGVLFLVWGPLILISLIGFLVARSSRISVILDSRGLAWRRRWGRHSARIKLDAISAAKLAVHETAWQAFRDWARDGTDEDVSSIRLHPGQAILVRLGEGREVSISLDQADEAADVLNALIVRHRTAKDPTLTSQ
jgi:hypothetical protein